MQGGINHVLKKRVKLGFHSVFSRKHWSREMPFEIKGSYSNKCGKYCILQPFVEIPRAHWHITSSKINTQERNLFNFF